MSSTHPLRLWSPTTSDRWNGVFVNKLKLDKETIALLTPGLIKGIAAGWPVNSTGCNRTAENDATCIIETGYCAASVTDCLVSTNPFNCFKTGGTLHGCV